MDDEHEKKKKPRYADEIDVCSVLEWAAKIPG